jgi:signal transduction histidine kinase
MRWRSTVGWGVPFFLAGFFAWLGFDAPWIDLVTRWTLVGVVAYLGQQFRSSPLPTPQFTSVAAEEKDQLDGRLLTAQQSLSSLHLPVLLQQLVDAVLKLIPCRGAVLILLDRNQEKPEYVMASGQAPPAIGHDLAALLPRDLFFEVLERKTVLLNTPQELHRRLSGLYTREFARQSLFVGSLRHQQHLAFLLLADRVGRAGFLARDEQAFAALREAAKIAIANARRFEEVQEAEKRHRELLHGLMQAQEQESKLVAQEWHDRISKKLFEVLQGLRSFQTVIARSAPENSAQFQQLTAEIDNIAALVRGLANELHPSVLEDFGVAAAIREYVTDTVAGVEEEPLQVTVQTDDIDQQLPKEAKLVLYRITQEALRNVKKHAGAKNVQIAFVQEHTGVSLMIKDDGRGFNPEQPYPGHFGLQYMRERAEAYGGTFQVVSAQGRGTEVCVRFPTPPPAP